MTKLVLILLAGLIFEAFGVVLLNQGLKQIGEVSKPSVAEVTRVIKVGATNPKILAGVFLEAVFFGCLLYLMTKGDVSFIWPLTSLGFVLTALAARFYLREEVSGLRWFGVFLIMAGAACITWSEQVQRARQQAQQQQQQQQAVVPQPPAVGSPK